MFLLPTSKINRPRHLLGWLLLGIFAGNLMALAQTAPAEEKPFRLAFSKHLFTSLNEADVRAAIHSVTLTISREKNIPADPNPPVTLSLNEAEEILRTKSADAFGMTTMEYWYLSKHFPFDHLLFTATQGSCDDSYVVLVRDKSTFASLKDLQGKKINIQSGARTYLAPLWLDLELQKLDRPDCAHFFGKIDEPSKASKATLPVFFGQADACLITQRGYETLKEMNPQLGRELRILARSPAYVTLVIGFCSDYLSPLKPTVIGEFCRLHLSTYGKQALLMIQADEIVEQPQSIIQPSIQLIEEHAKICPLASETYFAKFKKTYAEHTVIP